MTSSASLASTRIGALLSDDDRREAAAEQLIRLLGLSDEPPEDDAMWAVRRVLVALARQTPVIAVIDDLHWACAGDRRSCSPARPPGLRTAARRHDVARRSAGDHARVGAARRRRRAEELVAALLDGAAIGPETLCRARPCLRRKPALSRGADALSLRESGTTPPPTLDSLLAARLARLPERSPRRDRRRLGDRPLAFARRPARPQRRAGRRGGRARDRRRPPAHLPRRGRGPRVPARAAARCRLRRAAARTPCGAAHEARGLARPATSASRRSSARRSSSTTSTRRCGRGARLGEPGGELT